MPTESFYVATYKVRTEHRNDGTNHQFGRVLEIVGQPLPTGFTPKAVLSFQSIWNVWNNDKVGYITFSSSQGPQLAGYFGDHDFDLYYKMLKEERPLFIFYERPAGPPVGGQYCTMVGLGSSHEPIGEGPKDFS
jgi:hypothetical protein